MTHHQDSNVEECKRVQMRVDETNDCFNKMHDIIHLALETDEMLLNHSKEISNSASGDILTRIKLLSENIIAERDARQRIVVDMMQIYDKSYDDYRQALEMNEPRDIMHFGNAYVARFEKRLDKWLPFVKKVNPSYDKHSTEMKRLLSIPPSDKNFYSKLSAEISEYRSKLEIAHRDVHLTPFVRKSLQGFDAKSVKMVPRQSSTVTIGKEAKTIEVGGCKVSFPAGTFTGAQPVKMTTEIDAEKWPSGREAITPTLLITAKNFQKPATIALPSWCSLKDENVGIDLMLFNEDTEKWKVITPEAVRNDSSLEFQSDQGGQFIATLRAEQSSTVTYVVRPIICIKNSEFVVALIRDVELDRDKLMDDMKSNFGDDFMTKKFCPLPCAMTQTIDSCIKCVKPRQGFEFVASGTFSHNIESIIKYAIPSYGLCELESDAPKTNVTLEFELREGDKPLRKADCFRYCWEPGIVVENTKDQIEETFDDISSCFINIETFRVFAISKRGFGLTDTQLAKVTDDHTEDYKQRRAILQLWRKRKGTDATAKKLRELVDKYFAGKHELLHQEKERLEDAFTDISSRFSSAQEFGKFAFAGSGLGLSFVEVDEIKSDNARELERRVAMVRLWSQREGERGTPANLRKLVDQYFNSQKST